MSPIFLHGLDSSGQGHKARFIKALIPNLRTPNFTGSLSERMAQLEPILALEKEWVIVGSSFGGLMAALWTLAHPQSVRRLILLAPALHRPEFDEAGNVSVPTLLVHGQRDTVVPPDIAESRARSAFSDLTVRRVDDDHRLVVTSQGMDWVELLS